MPPEETLEYFTDLAKRLLENFPECGLLTLARMLRAYDQSRKSEAFYYQVILKVTS